MNYLEIPLSRGMVAVVDAADAPALLGFTWHAVRTNGTFYAARRDGDKTVYMHRQILGLLDAPRTVFVDHDDNNGLNNRRSNIKVCTPAENSRKRRRNKGSIRPRGVYKQRSRFIARIGVDGKYLYLGSFKTEDDACAAYAWAAQVYFGSFAPKECL